MLASPCAGGICPYWAGSPALSLHLLGMGEASCPKSLVCLYTAAWPQGAITAVNMASASVPLLTGTPQLRAVLSGFSVCKVIMQLG